MLANYTINFKTSDGVAEEGRPLRMTRETTSFELYDPTCGLRVSELIPDFHILLGDRQLYNGPAKITSLTSAGTHLVCEVYLDPNFVDAEFFTAFSETKYLRPRFTELIKEWQTVYAVVPEFKLTVSDIQSFLLELSHWMERIEVGLQSLPAKDRVAAERKAVNELSPEVLPVLDDLFEKFETVAARLKPETIPAHRHFVQRLLHPLVLCSPFADRSYRKPCGYAGDYEMVNMMLRDPQQGTSLFAKLFNVWLLHQGSAAAHRNRIQYLKTRLAEEISRAIRLGRPARIFNLGCGPAAEVLEFLAENMLGTEAEFELSDFNEETLRYLQGQLTSVKPRGRGVPQVSLVRKSVQGLLKETAKTGRLHTRQKYDLVYCAGLFDYLPDRTCRHLMNIFRESVVPGGLVLATNVAPHSPNRGSLELILDWHLIYRDAAGMASLCEPGGHEEDVRVLAEDTGGNVFLEVRNQDGR